MLITPLQHTTATVRKGEGALKNKNSLKKKKKIYISIFLIFVLVYPYQQIPEWAEFIFPANR
jgi:hypothetical protein